MPTLKQIKYWESKKGKAPWNKGLVLGKNPEHSKKMKGKPSSFLGKRHTVESKQKMKEKHLGMKPWNIGKNKKDFPQLSNSGVKRGSIGNRLGKRNSLESKIANGIAHQGEKCSFWKGGVSKISALIRGCFEYRQWRADVFTRDNWTCQDCGIRSGCGHTVVFQAHHIKSQSKIIEDNNIKTIDDAILCQELWNINNGITLCLECHKKTENYGAKGKNNKHALKNTNT